MDTLYNPLTGGTRFLINPNDTEDPKALIKKNHQNQSMKVLPSSINYSK